jgi:hypothetical protein
MRYRLPEVLGGGEYNGTPTSFAGTEYRCFDVDGVNFYVRLADLTEAKPPLPPEPPVRSVVLAEAPFATPVVFFRYPNGWAEPAGSTYYDWAKVCSYGTPVRYVPDPFAEPVTLPWMGISDTSDEIFVNRHLGAVAKLVWVAVDGTERAVKADVAKAMARALWAAADEVAS